MDGTETGWGRPTESPPRWRALFDRARAGGRAGEQPEPDPDDDPAAGGPRSGRQPPGNGQRGPQPTSPARPGHQGYFGGPPPAPPGSGRGGPDPGADPGYPGESRYAILENGYRPEQPAGESRYAILESGYRPPPATPPPPIAGSAPIPGQHPAPPAPPAPPNPSAPPERGYRPDPGYHRDPRYPAPAPAPPERGYPQEPGYRALDRGYRPPIPAQPAPPGLPPASPGLPPAPANVPPPPAAAPAAPAAMPVRPVPPPPGRKILDSGYSGRPRWGEPPAPPPPPLPPPAQPARSGRAKAELDRAVDLLRRDLGTPRVLAFANPKGGVHKTTATVLAAATVGSVRGRGVLAWDDNELRGTLGLRAGSARHARTIRHLVADLIEVEALNGAQLIGRLDDYLRHASDGSYDVLAGEESPRFAQRLDQHTVRRVLEMLRRTHDVICVDTGNNVESANWQTVLQAADQLVVTTVPREDAAFTADWMLDLLHEIGMSELADNAVTLLSCPTPGRSPLMDDLERHFATRTRAVAVVPYDPALETGSSIEYDQVQPETREAWLMAAAAMLEPFAR